MRGSWELIQTARRTAWISRKQSTIRFQLALFWATNSKLLILKS